MSIDSLLTQVNYADRKSVKDSITPLTREYSSLTPKIGTLISNDGVTSKLILLSGTIPILFQNQQYNIPVDIFLPLRFPMSEPPIVYVRPTSDMIVKSNHPYACPDGLIVIPYLNQWNRSSTLLELVKSLSNIFSHQPPLFQKPPNFNPNQYYGAFNSSSTTIYGQVLNDETSYTSHQYESNYSKSSSQFNDDGKKKKLIDDVTSKLQYELHSHYKNLSEDLDSEFLYESKLQESNEKSSSHLKELNDKRECYKHELELIQEKFDLLKEKVNSLKNNPRESSKSDIIQEHLIPYDDLSNQIIQLNAEYMTIEDTMYYLNKAFMSSSSTDSVRKIDVTSFIKEIRKLARDQFLKKAQIDMIEQSLK